jgi:ubiquinone/menaquinone biosynthesis C-methylase UbiE
MEYSEKQKIEQMCFNSIVHQKWDGKSFFVDKTIPPFAEYSGDLLAGAKKFLGPLTHKKILEIGCGNGELSVWLAKNGAEVWGVDISDESIKIAEQRSAENHTATHTHFFSQPAESLPFENNFFDVVFINVTLHHLEIETSLKEFKRVLKPQGIFVAIEPFTFSDLIQKIRTSKLITKIYPIYQETPTERILNTTDLLLINKYFSPLSYSPFRIFSPFIFKIKTLFTIGAKICFPFEKNDETKKRKLNRAFQKFDEFILLHIPFMKKFSRYLIIKGQKT